MSNPVPRASATPWPTPRGGEGDRFRCPDSNDTPATIEPLAKAAILRTQSNHKGRPGPPIPRMPAMTIQLYDLASADGTLLFSPYAWRVRMALIRL